MSLQKQDLSSDPSLDFAACQTTVSSVNCPCLLRALHVDDGEPAQISSESICKCQQNTGALFIALSGDGAGDTDGMKIFEGRKAEEGA